MAQKDFLTSRIQEAAEMAVAYQTTSYLDFYEPTLQMLTEREIARYPGSECAFFGGHEYCERKMLCIFPQSQEPTDTEFPIDCIQIKDTSGTLTHQDVLGALMNVGIEREKTGDININNEMIQFFVSAPLGKFIEMQLNRIGRFSVAPKKASLNEIIVFEPNFIDMDIIVPSMRADAVIHAVFRISRSEASALIKAEKVKVNHKAINKPAVSLKEGDVLSVRSKGRIIIDAAREKKKKGNIKLRIKKFA